MSNSLQLDGLWPTRLLCPWNSPGKNIAWVASPFFTGSSWPGSPTLQADSLPSEPPGKLCSSKLGHKCGGGLVSKLCPTLCNPTDCSPPGSSVHGILQARILEWVAILFSRGSSWPWDWTGLSCIAGGFFTVWATREALSCVYMATIIICNM